MRALVQGAVNDKRTRILLDTGENVSVITDTFAKKLRLRDVPDHGRRIDIQGINESKVSTTRRAQAKITLGWDMVYEFEMWVMAHSAGVDVVLGTDFMIPAGIRLDLFHEAAQLPNEIRIPLVKTKNMLDSEEHGSHVNAGPSEQLDIPGHEWREYRLSKRQVALEIHILWVRRTEKIIPSVTKFRRGRPQRIKLTNVSDRAVYFPVHDDIAVLVPAGDLSTADHPQTDGQAERVNRVLGDLLKSYAHSFQQRSDCLPMAEFAINNSVHASTGHTPFYVNAMRHPRLPSMLGMVVSSLSGGIYGCIRTTAEER
ncbi:hypothetical protein PI124_g23270 [Phytophthora idaei]|nr:hypothetical protein PI126_g23704 [Phytophthora idaei]KAG3231635.1 hypothetical protein PI124_g23270 [Phytophthora idaei]